MISSLMLSVFLKFIIAAVIQISYVLAELTLNDIIETGSYPNTNTTEAVTVHLPVVTSTDMDLVTSSLPNGKNSSSVGIKNDSIGLPNSTTLLRTFYVLVAVTGIILVYFVIRTVRLRLRKNRKTRYGLLSTHDDSIEMRHLEEDDEEDATVFDRALSRSRR